MPPQDTRICGTICVCQMTAVLSSVAIVYLTVAIYMPTMREFQSGISERPVICTTTRNVSSQKCDWSSCSEWCLSKPSGGCAQIYVNIRRNGSALLLHNCSHVVNKTCFGFDPENAKKYTCIRDECKMLTGTFNCTDGVCINITDAFRCEFRNTEPPLKCNQHRGKVVCMSVAGLNSCARGECSRILEPYNCDRRCVDIPTRNKNVIVLSGDRTYLTRCDTAAYLPGHVDNDGDPAAVLSSSTTQSPPPESQWLRRQQLVWTEEQGDILIASCMSIVFSGPDELLATDCVNGSLLRKDVLADFANFSHLTNLNAHSDRPITADDSVAPREHKLLIAKDSHLHINLQGCVNTLRGECDVFIRRYGKDGSDHNARARFRCHYATGIPELAVVRFDLERTYKEFLVASVVPVVMLVISCLTLLLCQRTVEVGDDAKMRFKRRSIKTLFPLHDHRELDSIASRRLSSTAQGLDNTSL